MKATVVSFTHKGACLCARLTESLNSDGEMIAKGYAKERMQGISLLQTDIKSFAKIAFYDSDALIFIGAAGIAVRAIAPYLKAKDTDPAVLVVDELARFVVPILSGHIGGANRLARHIAGILGAQAVITTATDMNGAFAADEWAAENDCSVFDIRMIKDISSAILSGETVGFHSDFPIEGDYPLNVRAAERGKIGICVSLDTGKNLFGHTLMIVPRCVAVGIGCKKGVAPGILEKRFLNTLSENNLPLSAVTCVATINIKAEEEALLALCRKYKFCLRTYTPEELNGVSGEYSASDFVKKTTGVDNVCERAAVKATGGDLILRKNCGDGVTLAAAKADWRGTF